MSYSHVHAELNLSMVRKEYALEIQCIGKCLNVRFNQHLLYEGIKWTVIWCDDQVDRDRFTEQDLLRDVYVEVLCCNNLPKVDLLGKIDPYVRIERPRFMPTGKATSRQKMLLVYKNEGVAKRYDPVFHPVNLGHPCEQWSMECSYHVPHYGHKPAR